MLIIPLNLDSDLLLLHNSKVAYWSGTVSYAWEIFLYVCDRHIYDPQACGTGNWRSVLKIQFKRELKKLMRH